MAAYNVQIYMCGRWKWGGGGKTIDGSSTATIVVALIQHLTYQGLVGTHNGSSPAYVLFLTPSRVSHLGKLMMRAEQWSEDEELNAQLEREGLQPKSSSRRLSQQYEPISSDENSSPFTPQSPINPTTTVTEAVNMPNKVALPSQGKQLAKRKRSASEDHLLRETNKKSKTENSSDHVVDDPSRVLPGKLNRPTLGLLPQETGADFDRQDPFGVPDVHPKSVEWKAQEGRPRSGPKPRDQVVGGGETRQLRSRKRAAVSSRGSQVNPGNRLDVAHDSTTDETRINNPGSAQLQGHDAPGEDQSRAGSPQHEPLKEAEHDVSASTEEAEIRQTSPDSATGSEMSAEQTALDEHERGSEEAQPRDSREQVDNEEVLERGLRGTHERDKLEVFGRDCLWKEIHEARRKIGQSKVQGDTIREIPKLKTGPGKRMDRLIRTASQFYDPQHQNEANVERHDSLERLTACIEELSESSCQDQEREVAQDVYAHVIPKLVLLLERALRARSTQLSNRTNIAALEEIIHLQGLLLTLCKKARGWRARPMTKTSIIKPTIMINKKVEILRKEFKKQLEKRRRKLAMQAAKAKKPAESDELGSQQAWEAAKRKAEERRQLILDDCRRGNATQWGRRPISQSQKQQPNPRPVPTPNVVEGWSREQSGALVVELLRRDHKDLTGKT
ncbi:MAG: hypothetical protein Q9182_002240 [Xanthomendoza sp. 2 TL-2023]